MDGTVDVRLERADRPLAIGDLPSDVRTAVETYLAAARAFVPGRDSTLVVELPQLAIAATLLRALELPTLQALFDAGDGFEDRPELAIVRPNRAGARKPA